MTDLDMILYVMRFIGKQSFGGVIDGGAAVA